MTNKLTTRFLKKEFYDALRNKRAELDRISLARLARRTRTIPDDPLEFTQVLLARMLTDGVEESTRPEEAFEVRRKLLWILTHQKHWNASERFERALLHVASNLEVLTSWHVFVDDPAAHEQARYYQLDTPSAWWHPGPGTGWLRRMQEQRDLQSFPELHEMEEAGFRQLSQASYRVRMRELILLELITVLDQHRLQRLAGIILLLTERVRVNATIWETFWFREKEAAVAGIISELVTRLRSQVMVALPRQPLSVLPKEMNNLAMHAAEHPSAEGEMRFHEERTGQLSLLVYDRALVLKESELPDTYIRIPIAPDGPAAQSATEQDPLGALLHSLRGLAELGPSTRMAQLQDVPRVVAGMFMAATQDRGLTGVNTGEFVDALTAHRLTHLVGLNVNDDRHKQRVRQVREWLETIEMSRPVLHQGKKGERNWVEWRGPIIQSLRDRYQLRDVDLSVADGEGTLSVLKNTTSELRVFRLSPELWQMRSPRSQTASFMLLDTRAFNLDAKLHYLNSEPFNLYWTIIQRAYQASASPADADRFERDGTFSPRALTLYRLSGMERAGDMKNPNRVRQRFREYLSLMVDEGVLLDWNATMLEGEESDFTMERFRESMRIKISLPMNILRYLDGRCFKDGVNPFRVV